MNLAICHRCPHVDRKLAGQIPCGADPDKVYFAIHAEQNVCPIGSFGSRSWPEGFEVPASGSAIDQQPQNQSSDPAIFGPPLWKVIHTKRIPTPQWLDSIIASLPCGDCRNEAVKYLAANAPDFANWFVYSYHWHQSVRIRKGQTPLITLQEAMARWQSVGSDTALTGD